MEEINDLEALPGECECPLDALQSAEKVRPTPGLLTVPFQTISIILHAFQLTNDMKLQPTKSELLSEKYALLKRQSQEKEGQ